MPSLSVIIPTYKRPLLLRQCLEHLAAQTIADEVQVLVVSDGHDDETAAMFPALQAPDINFASHWNMDVQFLEIPKSHQGVARNAGVKLATAPYVLFSQDDIFLEPEACELHLKTLRSGQKSVISDQQMKLTTDHSSLTSAVLGFTTWDPTLEITPVMHWLESSGWQFGYPFIKKYAHQFLPADIQHKFTYTSHISLPTVIAKKIPFREDVTLYGWEDIEWGFRLKEAGIRLWYEPDAQALHHHPMTREQSLRRMETLGKSAIVIEQIRPELNVVPKGLKKMIYGLLRYFPTLRGKHLDAFLRGLTEAA